MFARAGGRQNAKVHRDLALERVARLGAGTERTPAPTPARKVSAPDQLFPRQRGKNQWHTVGRSVGRCLGVCFLREQPPPPPSSASVVPPLPQHERDVRDAAERTDGRRDARTHRVSDTHARTSARAAMAPTECSMSFTESEHGNSVLEKLRSQREEGRFCDVTLYVEGRSFR